MQRNQWSCNNLQTPWMPPFHSLLPLMDNNVTTAFCFPVCSVGSVQLPLTWLTAVQCWAVQAGQSLVTAGPGHIQDIHPWPDSVRLVRLARTVIHPVWPNCLECLCVKCDYDSAASLLWCLQGTQLLDSCDHPWRLDTAETQSVLVGFCRGTCRILVLATSVFQKTVNKIICETFQNQNERQEWTRTWVLVTSLEMGELFI